MPRRVESDRLCKEKRTGEDPAAFFIYSKGVSMNSKNLILLAIFAFSVIFNH